MTEIFGDYPHEWGLRNHFGDGTIRPPGHMSRTFLQPGGAHGANSLPHALLLPEVSTVAQIKSDAKMGQSPPQRDRQEFPRLTGGPAICLGQYI